MVSMAGLCLSVGKRMKREPYSEGMSLGWTDEFFSTWKIHVQVPWRFKKELGSCLNSFLYLSMAGLEPARVSPHAPQTCTYTDSVTSTSSKLFYHKPTTISSSLKQLQQKTNTSATYSSKHQLQTLSNIIFHYLQIISSHTPLLFCNNCSHTLIKSALSQLQIIEIYTYLYKAEPNVLLYKHKNIH